MATKTNYEKNGNKYFRVTASIGRDSTGKLIRKEFYGKSKKEAEQKKEEYLHGIKSGLNVDYKNVTLNELMHTWLFEVVRISNKIKPSTFQKYEGIYRLYIKDSEISTSKLCDLKTLQIQRYYNKLYENDKSSNVIKNLNKLLKCFLNYAVDEDYVLKNPCSSKIVIPGIEKVEKAPIEIFSDDEIKLLKSSLDGHRYKCIILMALGTGLRQGELLGLKWTDINMNTCELKVERSLKQVNIIAADGSKEYKTIIQTPKSKTSIRTVPIPSALIPIIKEHAKIKTSEKLKAGSSYINSDYIFTTELGKTIDARNLTKCYKRILNKAGITYKKFHSLRHTYATKLFESNVPLKTVQILLGHSDISMTANIYTHVMPKEKIKAVENLNSLFG